jgi:hypothetical protein
MLEKGLRCGTNHPNELLCGRIFGPDFIEALSASRSQWRHLGYHGLSRTKGEYTKSTQKIMGRGRLKWSGLLGGSEALTISY